MAGIVDDKAAAGRQQQPRDGDSSGATIPSNDLQLPDINTGDNEAAPPPYGENHDQVHFSQNGFDAGAEVTGDGRVNININAKNRRLADLLAPTLQDQLAPEPERPDLPPAYIPPSLGGRPGQTPPPKLNVVVQIVGSRGDVQPFVALAKVLKDTYGHRVRIATHPTFRTFVEENGLEFFSIGGDPAELMAFMVKHPGLMPGFDAITSGEVSKRRKGIEEILMGCWRSCIEGGDGLGPAPQPHASNAPLDISLVSGNSGQEPFVADAIIANPPSFAHVHIAEKMGIPVHMMFTMPWSPTRAFPHPLANIQSSNTDDVMTNYMSYTLVEMMTWQGLGDVINRFRKKALDLPPLSMIWAPGLLSRLKISWTYCWSPALIPKPNDWGRHIDVSGFYFLNLASSFTPDPDLAAFLRDGPPPVYIGFGSIVVDDPNAMTEMIFEAVRLSGVRALVSKGWGGLGADDLGKPDGVFMLGNVPHDWLFEHVSCVVHHGGAGTTAAGIKAGKPTLVVPFFGDQPFWGAMIAKANAGPEPIPYKQLTAEKLAEAIKFCIQPETLEQAKVMGQKIREEKGTDVGGKSFHDHLEVDKLRCTLAPSKAAAWRVRRTQVRLSAFAAAVLVEQGILQWSDLKLYRMKEYRTEEQPPDPISACAFSLVTDIGGIGMAIADMPRELFKSMSNPKKKEKTSPNTANPPATESETSLATPQGITSDQKSTSATSLADTETLNSVAPTASHSNASQRTLSDTASSISGPASPDQPNTQASANQKSWKDHMKQAANAAKDRGGSPVNYMDAAVGTSRGVGRVVTTSARTPMNFCLGLARGFRNMPKLYNDETVRPVDKVTGVGSGFMVAGKEFGYGVFDGITGLVTQPLKGAEKEGMQGLIKGFGKGIGGIVAKPAAGFWSIPAYTMQGFDAEISRYFSKSVQNYIISSRAVQGQHEMQEATPGERNDVVQRWHNFASDLDKFYRWKKKENVAGKQPEETRQYSPEAVHERPRTGWLHTKNLSFEERKKLHADKEAWERKNSGTSVSQSKSSGASNTPTQSSEDEEFEKAIQTSIQETSRGNAEEDAQVEAAMRESINAVRQRSESDEAPPLPLKDSSIFKDAEYRITDEEYQALVEQAIQQSLGNDVALPEYSKMSASGGTDTASNPPAGSTYHDDKELQQAIEASKKQSPPPLPPREENDEDFERAIAASKEAMEKESSQRTEEDIVMEYVKKQSLAEEEYRKKMAQEGVRRFEAAGDFEAALMEHQATISGLMAKLQDAMVETMVSNISLLARLRINLSVSINTNIKNIVYFSSPIAQDVLPFSSKPLPSPVTNLTQDQVTSQAIFSMSPYRYEEFERGQSQASYFPSGPNELEQSDSDYDSPPKKRTRRNPGPGNPAREPCLECAIKMLPPHAVEAGCRLQEAAVLMNNGQHIHDWPELVALFEEVMQQPELPVQQPEAPDIYQALEGRARDINQAPGVLPRAIEQCSKQILEDHAQDSEQTWEDLLRVIKQCCKKALEDHTPDKNQAQEVTNARVLLLHESVDQLNERTRAIETLLRQILDERRRPDVAARGTYFPSPLPPNAG
ncbi:uncharacterized protein FIESC28_10497 [Fusarium coffeatum]|uniref:Uncharacterized protein n=1 Tax=Fusarium coffeatum TaxID=231269 RepID=A0A366QSA7_9HYPO|nr:uncharacterized protein FIESC28_10497 [Fusarium coffeatum]RBR07804.1 hypothetical protein FIESC28_10497 [Fusarium coffeatum]